MTKRTRETSAMRIDLVDDPAAFRSRVAAFFSEEPFSTNVIAMVNERMLAESPTSNPETIWIIVTGADGGTIGAAMANGPWNLFVSTMPSDAAVALAVDWLGSFHDEATPEDPSMDWQEVARHRIDAGEIWAWDVHGEPVAMAACHEPIAGVARIGPVYTPPAHRCRGYAAGATNAATRDALEHGAEHVMLYADAANVTSNALYQRLGYRFDHEAVQYRFRPSAS